MKFDLTVLLKRTLEDAEEICKPFHTIRVVKENGQSYPITLDYCTTRINVEVEDDIIVEIQGIG